MANQELVELIGLLNFKNPNSLKEAEQELSRNTISYTSNLKQLLSMPYLPSISQASLRQAKICSSVAINYLFLRGVKDMEGVKELSYIWDILFNWEIDVAHKKNLQQSFTFLLQTWEQHHEMIFEQGVAKMSKCLVQLVSDGLQSVNETVRLKKGETFSVGFHYLQSISNALSSLLLICKACLTAIRWKEAKQKHFAYLTKIIVDLFKAIAKISQNNNSNIRDQLELINWAVECCQSMKTTNQQKLSLLRELYVGLRLDEMMLSIFKLRSLDRPHKQNCWGCINSSQQVLRLKILAAETYHCLVVKLGTQENINLFLNNQQSIQILLSTISCNICQASPYQAQFVSILLQIYISYFEAFPHIFQTLHQVVLKMVVFPLMLINQDFLCQFKGDALQYLDCLNDDCLEQTKNNPITKSIKVLRRITTQSQEIYSQVINMVYSLLKKDDKKITNSKTYFQIAQQHYPNFQTSWIILIAILPSLQSHDRQKIVALIEKGTQFALSDLSLTLITFLLSRLLQSPHAKSIFNDYLLEGLNRNSQFLEQFMVEMELQSIQHNFSWSIFQLVFVKLLIRKSPPARMDSWMILECGLAFHWREFSISHLQTIIISCQQVLSIEVDRKGIRDRTYIIKILQLVRIIVNSCSPQQLSALHHFIIKMFHAYPLIKDIGFQLQIMDLINLFFNKQQTLNNDLFQVLKIGIEAYKYANETHQRCIQLFNTCIKLGKHVKQVWNMIILAIWQRVGKYRPNDSDVQFLFIDLFTIQYIIHEANIDQSTLEDITSTTKAISSKMNYSIIQVRIINIMLASRVHSLTKLFDWHFIHQICKSKRPSKHEQSLVLLNIQKLINNSKKDKNWHDYASVLKVMYQIHQYSLQRKLPQQQPSLQKYSCLEAKALKISPFKVSYESLSAQIQNIFHCIIKRKLFVYHLIEQNLSSQVSCYFRGLIKTIKEEAK